MELGFQNVWLVGSSLNHHAFLGQGLSLVCVGCVGFCLRCLSSYTIFSKHKVLTPKLIYLPPVVREIVYGAEIRKIAFLSYTVVLLRQGCGLTDLP